MMIIKAPLLLLFLIFPVWKSLLARTLAPPDDDDEVDNDGEHDDESDKNNSNLWFFCFMKKLADCSIDGISIRLTC